MIPSAGSGTSSRLEKNGEKTPKNDKNSLHHPHPQPPNLDPRGEVSKNPNSKGEKKRKNQNKKRQKGGKNPPKNKKKEKKESKKEEGGKSQKKREKSTKKSK